MDYSNLVGPSIGLSLYGDTNRKHMLPKITVIIVTKRMFIYFEGQLWKFEDRLLNV